MHVLHDVMSNKDIQQIYTHVIENSLWKINSAYGGLDNPELMYPRMQAMDENGMHDPFLAGYFIATMARVRDELLDKHGFRLPTQSIAAIGFNAQRKGNVPEFHTDADGKGPHVWSAVGFLTPQWDPSWGGELQIEDKTFTYGPGDFIVFRSNKLHDALPIKVDTPFWRVSVSCMMK